MLRREERPSFARGVTVAIRVVEKPQIVLRAQDASYGCVNVAHRDATRADERRELPEVDPAHHVDVDARTQSKRSGGSGIRGGAMRNELEDTRPVAHKDAVPP